MNEPNNFNNQPLIVVLAGGNIISIFFNILKLLSEESEVDIIFNLFDNVKISEAFKKLLEQIKDNLKDNSYLRDYF